MRIRKRNVKEGNESKRRDQTFPSYSTIWGGGARAAPPPWLSYFTHLPFTHYKSEWSTRFHRNPNFVSLSSVCFLPVALQTETAKSTGCPNVDGAKITHNHRLLIASSIEMPFFTVHHIYYVIFPYHIYVFLYNIWSSIIVRRVCSFKTQRSSFKRACGSGCCPR